MGELDVAGPDGRGEAVDRAVGDLHGFLRITETNAAHDRPEDLLARDPHLGADLAEDGRLDVEALRLVTLDVALAPGEDAGALLLAALDVIEDAIHLPAGDLRPHLAGRVRRIADAQLL